MMERYSFFFSFFFFERRFNKSLDTICTKRGDIKVVLFLFFFFSFSKEPCNGGFISMHHFIFFIARAYDFAVFFCVPLFFFFFFPFSFLFRETQYFFYFSFASLYKGTV